MKKNTKYGILASIFGSAINLLLGIVKIIVGIFSNSISILFDGVNNFGDVISSVVGAAGIGTAGKKPDVSYPNGYSKIEHLAAFVIALITVVIGGIFIYSSSERLFFKMPIYFAWTYFGAIAVTFVIKIFMAVGYYFVYKRTGSQAIKALGIDSVLDCGISGSTLICYALLTVANTIIDAILGMIIGVVVLIGAFKMMISSIKRLTGYIGETKRNEIIEILTNSGIFKKIDNVRIYDNGSDLLDVYASGDINTECESDKIKSELNEKENINLYIVKE